MQFHGGWGARNGGQILAGSIARGDARPRYLGDEEWTESLLHLVVREAEGRRDLDPAFGRAPGVHHERAASTLGEAPVGAIRTPEAASRTRTSGDDARVRRAPSRGGRQSSLPVPPPTPEAYRALIGLYGHAEDERCSSDSNGATAPSTFIDPEIAGVAADARSGGWTGPVTVQPGVGNPASQSCSIGGATARVTGVTIGPFSLSRFDPVDQ